MFSTIDTTVLDSPQISNYFDLLNISLLTSNKPTDRLNETKRQELILLDTVRFVVQKICLPIILAIGIPGNLCTLVILSRNHMKSSTNFYLASLAFSDMFYLLFHFLLSFQHYDKIRGNYWYIKYLIGGYPLTDIFSNASVWIVVSFTTERFIVIGNPIKGKIFCTLKRAKYVVLVVFLISIVGTIPTFFERKVDSVYENEDSMQSSIINTTSFPSQNDLVYMTVTKNTLKLLHTIHESIFKGATDTTRIKKYYLYETSLYLNENYQRGYFWFTSVFFSFFPLTLILIFNSLLIIWIRKSSVIHREMNKTWDRNSRDSPRKRNIAQYQETRITYMLIVVVIIFTFCQLPSAILLLAFLLKPDKQELVRWRLCNNFANLLMAIHACLNFVLYCLLSKKFRATFSRIFLPCFKLYQQDAWIALFSTGTRIIDSKFSSRKANSKIKGRIYDLSSRNSISTAYFISECEDSNEQSVQLKDFKSNEYIDKLIPCQRYLVYGNKGLN
ncbi:unnamed protein product [Gordionus sp. m RMFG-2023]|uniref:thyrotropin-releasing hormone receptor-like n=1 Tax=Gordionus sp. m RMFG-2023 TaxID=3053472 RepID=UPI0030E5DB04